MKTRRHNDPMGQAEKIYSGVPVSDNSPMQQNDELTRLQQALEAAVSGREAEANLARNAAHRLSLLEAMMETVPVGVVLADANGQILHGNSRVEEMLRHPVLFSSGVEAYGEWVSYHEDGRRVASAEYPL